jgi:hypothetical protein
MTAADPVHPQVLGLTEPQAFMGKTTGTVAWSVANHEELLSSPTGGPVGMLGGLGPA